MSLVEIKEYWEKIEENKMYRTLRFTGKYNDYISPLYSQDKILITKKINYDDKNAVAINYCVWRNTEKRWSNERSILTKANDRESDLDNGLIFYKNLTPLTQTEIEKIKKFEESLKSNSGGKRKLKRSMKNKKNKK